MSSERTKKGALISAASVDRAFFGESHAQLMNEGAGAQKKLRKINPLGMRVVVALRKDTNMTEAGLYLPEGAKSAMAESIVAEVIEVASAIDAETHEEANVSGIPLGAVVLIPKQAGVRVPWDENLRIVDTKEVLAIIDEVSMV